MMVQRGSTPLLGLPGGFFLIYYKTQQSGDENHPFFVFIFKEVRYV